MGDATFPLVPSQGSGGALRGSILGGHAPIVNAHVFLMEGVWTGYSVRAKSLLSVHSTATAGTYPVTEDNTLGSVTNGLYYVTSDVNGAFNVTSDYTCDVGFPVYLYAGGGSPSVSTALNITGISTAVAGGVYTYTFTSSNLLYTGQSVQFSSSSLSGEWATLNNTTQTVLATPTASTFEVATIVGPGSGTNVQNGSATAVGPNNPAIVNLAMLGTCPGVGNFTNTINYVYVNEVSTAAMAYAMAGFATDSIHLSADSTNETGLQNAAINAANLYNIEGYPLELAGNSAQGEGLIANQTTVAGNGAVVPQAELDTVANILAACVDSANTAISPSTACTTLFGAATSTGVTGGAVPIDTATAAINMAHNPGAANVIGLWSLPSGVVPFSPHLTAAPKDFTVAINYQVASPGGIAIDAAGDAFIPTNSSSGYVTEIPPTGAAVVSATGGSGFDSIAVDSGGNVFVAAQRSDAMYAYTNSLGAVTGSPFASTFGVGPTSVVVDSAANGNYVYLTGSNNSNQIIQRFSNTATATPTVAIQSTITSGCLQHVTYLTLDTADDFWASVTPANSVCRVGNTGSEAFNANGYNGPTNVAIDSGGNGWFGAGQQTNLYRVSSTDTVTTFGVINNNPQGGLSSPSWVAIDSGNNVWVTNDGNSSISEFASTGAAITTSAGYQNGNLSGSSFLAIDASGDVWVPNKSSNTVTELIGAAEPTVTPLSALKPGARP